MWQFSVLFTETASHDCNQHIARRYSGLPWDGFHAFSSMCLLTVPTEALEMLSLRPADTRHIQKNKLFTSCRDLTSETNGQEVSSDMCQMNWCACGIFHQKTVTSHFPFLCLSYKISTWILHSCCQGSGKVNFALYQAVKAQTGVELYIHSFFYLSCRYVGLTTLPPSCSDCLEIWESLPSGTLRACPGL
jgi:hypothetical protein